MVFLHVTRGAVMTPVRLDNLTAVTVTDCCIMSTQRCLVTEQLKHKGCKQADKFILTRTVSHLDTRDRRTSGSCAGVQRKTGGSSP